MFYIEEVVGCGWYQHIDTICMYDTFDHRCLHASRTDCGEDTLWSSSYQRQGLVAQLIEHENLQIRVAKTLSINTHKHSHVRPVQQGLVLLIVYAGDSGHAIAQPCDRVGYGGARRGECHLREHLIRG